MQKLTKDKKLIKISYMNNKAVHFFYILLGLLFLLIIVYLFKTNYSLNYYLAKSKKLLVNYDEKKIFKLKKKLEKELNKCSNSQKKKKEKIILLLGRLSFVQALHSKSALRRTYLQRALKYFDSILNSQNDNLKPRLYFWIGITYYELGAVYYPQSIDFLIKALKSGYSQKIKIIKILNYIYLKNKDFNSIISINTEFMKQNYYDTDIVYTLGIAYKKKEKIDKAIRVFALITNIQNKNRDLGASVYNELISYYIRKENYKTALKFVQKFRDFYPENLDAKYMAALVLFYMGDSQSLTLLNELLNSGYTNKVVNSVYIKAKEKFLK